MTNEDTNEGPQVPNEDDSPHDPKRRAADGWEQEVATASVVVELAANLLEAEGHDGLATFGQAIAHLLHLAAVVGRSNGRE